MTEPEQEKRALRRQMRRMRGGLDASTLEAAGMAVVPHILSLPHLDAGPVLVYIAMRRELPTRALIDALWAAGHTVAIPAMTAAGMEARLHRPTGTWTTDAMDVPTVEGPAVEARTCICPGLAFDRRGGRLGYGGGAYDRWLAGRAVRTVGLCVDEAVLPQVPTGPHDALMAYLVTPSGIWPTEASAV